MALHARDIEAFLARAGAVVLVRVTQAEGSVPREAGAFMLVSASETRGTIGGGQLEFIAIDRARRMLDKGEGPQALDIPLGPDIGQCCGGRVALSLEIIDDSAASDLIAETKAAEETAPHVLVFGAGHVGQALGVALSQLPYNVSLIDTRPDVLASVPEMIETHALAVPEAAVRAAPAHSAFVVMTHDHALDFLIMREVLMRRDAAYAGMIGSKSKRAQFRHWFLREGGDEALLPQLICPIGAQGLGDKRPEIVAALVCAEIIVNLGQRDCPSDANDVKVRGDDMRMGNGG